MEAKLTMSSRPMARLAIDDARLHELVHNGLEIERLDIERLDLSHSSLTQKCFASLTTLLQRPNRVRCIDLSNNLLTCTSAFDLSFGAFLFRAHTSLETLILDNTHLTESQLVLLADSLVQSQIKRISIRGHPISARLTYRFIHGLQDQHRLWLKRFEEDASNSTQLTELLELDLETDTQSPEQPSKSSCCSWVLPHCRLCCVTRQARHQVSTLPPVIESVGVTKSSVPLYESPWLTFSRLRFDSMVPPLPPQPILEIDWDRRCGCLVEEQGDKQSQRPSQELAALLQKNRESMSKHPPKPATLQIETSFSLTRIVESVNQKKFLRLSGLEISLFVALVMEHV